MTAVSDLQGTRQIVDGHRPLGTPFGIINSLASAAVEVKYLWIYLATQASTNKRNVVPCKVIN